MNTEMNLQAALDSLHDQFGVLALKSAYQEQRIAELISENEELHDRLAMLEDGLKELAPRQ